MAPGDQLTQASGQWTVTIPYSSLTYNLPQGSGFQDPTFAEEKDERSILSEHYISLKRYLSVTRGDGNPNPPLSKHGYELQRLTSSQFLELSTDVGDELKRREFASRRPSNVPPGAGPPDYLFARGKLSPQAEPGPPENVLSSGPTVPRLSYSRLLRAGAEVPAFRRWGHSSRQERNVQSVRGPRQLHKFLPKFQCNIPVKKTQKYLWLSISTSQKVKWGNLRTQKRALPLHRERHPNSTRAFED